MLPSKPLRLLNDTTFRETDPPAERGRPLEWRRSFNTISLTVRNPRVEYLYTINEVDFFAGSDEGKPSASTVGTPISGSSERKVRVLAALSQDDLRDSIYFTQEQAKTSGLFSLVQAKGDIRLTLTDGPPTEQRGPFAAGAFPGVAFRANHEPGEDYVYIEVTVPTEH
jgi:hypothetical protein